MAEVPPCSPKPPFLMTLAQLRRLSPYVPLSPGAPRVDDRRVVSGIIYVIRHGLQWRDAPAAYGPHKTLYNRFVRWSRLGVFDHIFVAWAAEGGPPDGMEMVAAKTDWMIFRERPAWVWLASPITSCW